VLEVCKLMIWNFKTKRFILVSRWPTLHDCKAQLRTNGKWRRRRDHNQCSLWRPRPWKRAIHRKKDTFIKVISYFYPLLNFMYYRGSVGYINILQFWFYNNTTYIYSIIVHNLINCCINNINNNNNNNKN